MKYKCMHATGTIVNRNNMYGTTNYQYVPVCANVPCWKRMHDQPDWKQRYSMVLEDIILIDESR